MIGKFSAPIADIADVAAAAACGGRLGLVGSSVSEKERKRSDRTERERAREGEEERGLFPLSRPVDQPASSILVVVVVLSLVYVVCALF